MDNLTHGLLGLAIGALRRPDGPRANEAPARGEGAHFTSRTDRAVLLASVLAAEFPDLDNFWPAPNPVLHALHAHRGLSHALVAAPAWALLATGIACLVFRRARPLPVFLMSLLSLLFAHLAADLWTGWGTRLLLPFSDARLSLDFAAVIDPFLTLPLIVGTVCALLWRRHWRRALLIGLAVAAAYLGFRISSRAILLHRVGSAYEAAERVEVFPALFSATGWRYAALLPEGTAVGRVSLLGAPREEGRHPHPPPLPADLRRNQTVAEALAWARLPLVQWRMLPSGEREVRVADLRYHLAGEPTLTFVVRVDETGEVVRADLDRGGSVGELLERQRRQRERERERGSQGSAEPPLPPPPP